MAVRIGINGYGRIGRLVHRVAEKNPEVEVVVINGSRNSQMMAHLAKYDSVHGTWDAEIEPEGDFLKVNGRKIRISTERDPARVPWNSMGVDVVIESTGKFTDAEKAKVHITEGGTKKVIISAPGKNEDATIVMGVNEDFYNSQEHHVVSGASCTTNCLAPVAKVLDDAFGIKHGSMTTVHAYTGDQRTLDGSHKDLRRARACGLSIVPTTTGAAKAVGLVLPKLEGKLSGLSMRVPVANVSIIDLVVEVEKATNIKEVNNLFKVAADGSLKGIMGYNELPLVSIDYVGDSRSAIVDGLSTEVMQGTQIKVLAWYDNEWGYSCRLIDLAVHMMK